MSSPPGKKVLGSKEPSPVLQPVAPVKSSDSIKNEKPATALQPAEHEAEVVNDGGEKPAAAAPSSGENFWIANIK